MKTINERCENVGRNPEEVKLIAVTKNRDLSDIEEAVRAGLYCLGENRVQEFVKKCENIGVEGAEWHFIGHLQTNKVRSVAGRVELIHSIDSLRLAEAVNEVAVKRNICQKVLIQVNASGEKTKGGFLPSDLLEAVQYCEKQEGLKLTGLMTIAPLAEDPEDTRPVFKKLRELMQEVKTALSLSEMRDLSMGMTDDYGVAIEEGATIIRIGRAIFD